MGSDIATSRVWQMGYSGGSRYTAYMAKSTSSTPSSPVTIPPIVRVGGAILLGAAVAITAAPLIPAVQAGGMILLAGAAFLLLFSHPYRRDVRAEYEARGLDYKISVQRMIPLFPDWLALMILPVTGGRFLIVIAAFIIATAYNYLVIPRIAGLSEISSAR